MVLSLSTVELNVDPTGSQELYQFTEANYSQFRVFLGYMDPLHSYASLGWWLGSAGSLSRDLVVGPCWLLSPIAVLHPSPCSQCLSSGPAPKNPFCMVPLSGLPWALPPSFVTSLLPLLRPWEGVGTPQTLILGPLVKAAQLDISPSGPCRGLATCLGSTEEGTRGA